jgi:hypothetical protein
VKKPSLAHVENLSTPHFIESTHTLPAKIRQTQKKLSMMPTHSVGTQESFFPRFSDLLGLGVEPINKIGYR